MNINIVSPVRRRHPDSAINLKSNELIHPAVDEIWREVTQRLEPRELRCYPVMSDTANALADYFGCSPSDCLVTPGSDSAIRLICDSYARSAGEHGVLLLQAPNYDALGTGGAVAVLGFGCSLPPMPARKLNSRSF